MNAEISETIRATILGLGMQIKIVTGNILKKIYFIFYLTHRRCR